jgi:hypothetical protein
VNEEGDIILSPTVEKVRASGHHYCIQAVQLAVQEIINCGSSLRGVEKIFELYEEFTSLEAPSFSIIRKWLGRIGLYELNRKKEYRTDWIFIIDLTVELGTQKCLVVLGVTQEYFEQSVLPLERGLSHEDVQLLAIEIMYSTKGELIEQKLTELSNKVGNPLQIISDHGSDVERGIRLYKQKHPDVIYTYDVTHAMALFIKYELESSDKYQSFRVECNQCRRKLQQTELAFLSPPSQRSLCRYFNIENLIDWAQSVLNSPIETIIELAPNIEPDILNEKLKEKFGWLNDYQDEILIWNQMVTTTRSLETQLKTCGINQQSVDTFELDEVLLNTNLSSEFRKNILEFITSESSQIPEGKTLLATSDVLESIFGKYKQFSSKSPVKQMGQMILNISLCTMNITISVIKEALETVRYIDLEIWLNQMFG